MRSGQAAAGALTLMCKAKDMRLVVLDVHTCLFVKYSTRVWGLLTLSLLLHPPVVHNTQQADSRC